MTKKLTMRLIGVGRQGSNHCNNLLAIEDTDLQYICDLTVDDTWIKKHSNTPNIVKNYDVILKGPQLTPF